jgi:predicted transcriptional regulator
MRISVDLSTAQIEALDALSKRNQRSRVAMIRQAVDDHLQKQGIEPESNAFGLWDRRNAGGLPYQRKMRGEW